MKKRNSRAMYACALTALALVLAVRAMYGFCWSDESFYLTFAQRLWNGQKLILDEWHPVQFYSVLFYPIVSLYHAFFGTQGIYLFAREVFVVAAWGASLFLFGTLCRSFSPTVSFLCAALLLSYSRGNIWGISYYNLFVLLCVLAFCLAYRGREGEKRRVRFFFAGVCLAGAVLCVPYFALFVILGLIAALISRFRRGDALWALGGVCLMAALFVLFFLPKDFSGVVSGLQQILSDPEHTGGPLSNLFAAIRDVKLLYYYEAGLMVLACLLLLLGARLLPGKIGTLPGVLLALFGGAVSFWRYRNGETGFAFYTLAIFSLPGLLLSWVRREVCVPGVVLRGLGILMGLSMAMSSNTEAIAFTVGLPVYAMGVVLQLVSVPKTDRYLRWAALTLVSVSLVLTFGSRIAQVFRDGPLESLTVTMDRGPAKGIRTTEAHARQYNEILDMTQDLRQHYSSRNSVFFSSILPWGYLSVDFPCGAPTAWRTPLNSPRIESYYTANPSAIPDIVVVLHPEIGDYADNSLPNENARSGWLWSYMLENKYEHLEYPCADVYVSPQAD